MDFLGWQSGGRPLPQEGFEVAAHARPSGGQASAVDDDPAGQVLLSRAMRLPFNPVIAAERPSLGLTDMIH